MNTIICRGVSFFRFKDFYNQISLTDIGMIKSCAFGNIDCCCGWVTNGTTELYIKHDAGSDFILEEYNKEKGTGKFFNTARNIAGLIEKADWFLEYLLEKKAEGAFFRGEDIIPVYVAWEKWLTPVSKINDGVPAISLLTKLGLIGYDFIKATREYKLFVEFSGGD